MDTISYKILSALMMGTNESDEELAKRISISVASLRDRVGSMERKGLIRGYQILPEVEARQTEAWAFFEYSRSGNNSSFSAFKHPYVRAAYAGPGRYSLMLRLAAPTLDDLAEFTRKAFQNSTHRLMLIKPIHQTYTGVTPA